MSKKIISILLLTFFSISLVGCSKASNNSIPTTEQNSSVTEQDLPVMEQVTIDFDTATADGEYVKANYPSEEWTYIDDSPLSPFMLSYTNASENNININISASQKSPYSLQELAKLFPEQLKESTPGINVTLSEVKKFGKEELLYVETVTKITDESIDLLIEEGSLTEEMIEQAGGREVLKSTPETKQISFGIQKDGKLVFITGSYFNDSEKEVVLKAMNTLAQTIEIK